MKTAIIRARIDKDLKIEAEHVLNALGLSVSEAMNLFMAQISLQRGIPFDVKIPNKATLKAFKDAKKKHGLTRYKNVKELFNKLGV